MKRTSLEIMSVSVVISLEVNAKIFSPICDSEIRAVKDVSIGAVEVTFCEDWLFLQTGDVVLSLYSFGNVPISLSTDD